jgi:hypothetical protein
MRKKYRTKEGKYKGTKGIQENKKEGERLK